MSFCSYSKSFHMYSITQVENLFIDEYMLRAPGDCVKVYLYGLRQCSNPNGKDNSLEDMARSLGMEKDAVEQAFRYWERLRLINRTQDGYEFVHIQSMLSSSAKKHQPKAMNQYSDFNNALQALFPSRVLQMQDYRRVYDWIEVLKMPEEVVLMLVQYVMEITKDKPSGGKNISIAYIDKIALDWAKGGIDTVAKAEEFLLTHELPANKPIIKLLRNLGLRRSPTSAEQKLYRKWTREWQFDDKQIAKAAEQTMNRRNPSFIHVDEILDKLREGTETPFDIQLLRDLGISRQLSTAAEKELIEKWRTMWNFEDELILLAARKTLTLQNPTAAHVDKILAHWHENSINNIAEAEKLWESESAAKKQKRESAASKKLDGLQYAQRQQSEEELNAVIKDISDLA